jgi:hypothetical protein
LSDAEAAERRLKHGANTILEAGKRHWSILLLNQFKSLLIGILAIAAFISWLTGHGVDMWVIIGIIIINALIGFVQEFRAEKAVEALRRLGERARFSKGLYAWVGFRSVGVPFEVQERLHGTSKWGLQKLTRFAFDGLSSFSTLPLKLATYLGIGISIFAMTYAVSIALRTLIWGSDVPGFPTLVVSVMFFSGIQLVFLGIIGEYIGRIFAEVKRRPLYIVAEEIGGEPAEKPEAVPLRAKPRARAHP